MTHHIETYEQQAAFASARLSAWHQLGTVVDHTMTAAEVLEAAHLANWNVRKEPLVAQVATAWDSDGNVTATMDVPLTQGKKFVVVRDNPFVPGKVDAFSPVGAHYEPVHNEDLTDLLDTIVGESGAHFETAASLRGGREVFVTMKMPEHMMVGGKDAVDLYLIAFNTHDASASFRFLVSPVRVVCANTLAAAMGNAKAQFKGRHVKGGAKAVIQEARETLGLTFKFRDEFDRQVERMIEQEYTDQQFTRLAASLYPTPKDAKEEAANNAKAHRAALTDLFRQSPTMTEIRGTRWAAYNAVTEYVDHVMPQRGKAGEALRIARATNVVTGLGNQIKVKAFDLLAV